MRSEEIRLSFHNLRVRFFVFAPDDGKILHRALFVSSPAGDAESWSSLAGMLADSGCLCVAAEIPGFGRSPCGKAVRQDNITRAQILWGILDEVETRRGDPQSGWHLIGHGSGAAAVMAMAQYQPDSALSRVLVCPVLDRFLPSPLHLLLKSRFGDRILAAWYKRNLQNRKRFSRLLTRLYGAKVPKARAAALFHAFNRVGMLSTLTRLMREGYSLSEDAYAVTSPVMLLWGMEDKIFGGEIPSRLLKRLPGAEKHRIRTAHMPMETDPEMLRDYLRGWFRFSEGREKSVVQPTVKGR